ncbi:hypothetical protein P154DRAFT_218942 [Amniculicola lignicola CBS 123094]|uniref:Uncharacterized protein n=1 Tax=Amniculicola lignicola CBS 123094 TaxID=1392246 RepID=A0A6A5WY47_9PLEO|nr:hypothetical protein P154DRAFT_218942 [Amniculicola lignicola CBS 123094]
MATDRPSTPGSTARHLVLGTRRGRAEGQSPPVQALPLPSTTGIFVLRGNWVTACLTSAVEIRLREGERRG